MHVDEEACMHVDEGACMYLDERACMYLDELQTRFRGVVKYKRYKAPYDVEYCVDGRHKDCPYRVGIVILRNCKC